MRTRCIILGCLILLHLHGGLSDLWALTLEGNQNLNGGSAVLDGAGVDDITPSAGPVYDWTDNDGDGDEGASDDAGDHLVLDTNKITTTDGTHLTFNLKNANGKGNLTGTGTLAFSTLGSISGDIKIFNVADLDCGGFRTGNTGSSTDCGDITIGEDGNRAGNIRVDYLDAHHPGSMGNPGGITVYGTNYVRIQNSAGTPGDLLTWAQRNYTIAGRDGHVTVIHDGEFIARQILTHKWADNYSQGGHVLLDGDGDGDGADGTCMVSNILTYSTHVSAWRGGNVTIRGYTGVQVHQIDTRCGQAGSYYAGDCRITNIVGNINITGPIDLENTADPANSGDLVLKASGTITLVDLDMDKVKTASFDAAGRTFFTGVVTNFNTGDPLSDPMDCPFERRVYYDSTVPGNAYLNKKVYALKSGGRFRPLAISGLVVTFR